MSVGKGGDECGDGEGEDECGDGDVGERGWGWGKGYEYYLR